MMHMVKNSQCINPKYLATGGQRTLWAGLPCWGIQAQWQDFEKYRVLLHLHLTRPGFPQDDAALGDA